MLQESTTEEDYSYEEAVLYRPLVVIGQRVMEFLLASDGTAREADAHSNQQLESNTATSMRDQDADTDFMQMRRLKSTDQIRTFTATPVAEALAEGLAPEKHGTHQATLENESDETHLTNGPLTHDKDSMEAKDAGDYSYELENIDSRENDYNQTTSTLAYELNTSTQQTLSS